MSYEFVIFSVSRVRTFERWDKRIGPEHIRHWLLLCWDSYSTVFTLHTVGCCNSSRMCAWFVFFCVMNISEIS